MDKSIRKILLVDDNEDDYIITRDLLHEIEGQDYELMWTSDFSKALELICEDKYDCCLIDYRLGEKNGIELIRELTTCGCGTPMILLTGIEDWKIDVNAMEAGALDYLVKDKINAPLLERSIRYAIDAKQAERTLRESLRKFRDLFESSPDAILVGDFNGNILDANQAAGDLYDMDHDHLVGKDIMTLVPPEVREEALSDFEELKSGKAGHLESLSLRQDGKAIPIEMRLSHIRHFGRPALLLHIRDMTYRKSLELQLSQAQKLESIGQLAAGIAHEINTPIQYVGDNTRFLKVAVSSLRGALAKSRELFETVKNNTVTKEQIAEFESAMEEAKQEYMLDEIPMAIEESLEGVERVANIVKAMKEFSHPGSKEKTLTDINKALGNTITVARNEWKYVADMETDFDPDLPLVPCLAGELNQAILNIIVNASHAIEEAIEQNGNGKGTIKIATKQIGEQVEISIRDTGTGIPKEIRSKLFDPFFTTKEIGQGTGQGLSIARSVILKHGGDIGFETETGKGTTFVIHLPLDPKTKKMIEKTDLPSLLSI